MSSEISRYIINTFSMAAEIFAVLLLFRKISGKAESKTTWIGYVCFALLALYYFAPASFTQITADITIQNFTNQGIRIILRFLIIWAVLIFTKEKPVSVKAYLAAYYTVLYLAVQNIRILCVLLCMFYNASWDYQFWFRLIAIPIEVLLMLLVSRIVHLEGITYVGLTRWLLACMAIFLQLYIKWSLLTTQNTVNKTLRWDTSALYSLFAILGIVALVILFEANLYNRSEKSRLELEKVRSDYEIQNAKKSMQANEEIRMLYHDMKNHLYAIKTLEQGNQNIEQYVDTLLDNLGGYESAVKTGNNAADAVLSEKIQRARREHIGFNICMDLSRLEEMNPVDIVTIFGNAVDNAIEACMKLPDNMERIIYLKSSAYANFLVIRISNQFSDTILQQGGKLTTSKEDASWHGIGITSIKRSIKKYGGDTQISIDNKNHWFRLTLMIPIE